DRRGRAACGALASVGQQRVRTGGGRCEQGLACDVRARCLTFGDRWVAGTRARGHVACTGRVKTRVRALGQAGGKAELRSRSVRLRASNGRVASKPGSLPCRHAKTVADGAAASATRVPWFENTTNAIATT